MKLLYMEKNMFSKKKFIFLQKMKKIIFFLIPLILQGIFFANKISIFVNPLPKENKISNIFKIYLFIDSEIVPATLEKECD